MMAGAKGGPSGESSYLSASLGDPVPVSEHWLEGSSMLDRIGKVENIRTEQIQQQSIVI